MNRYRSHLSPLMAVISLVAASCVDVTQPVPSPMVSEDLRPTAVATSNRFAGHLDDEFTMLVDQIPGFGGLFYDSARRLNVYLLDPRVEPTASMVLEDYLTARGREGSRDVANMVVHQGRYDFRQLASWRRAIAHEVALDGLTQTDVDEGRNLVVVGVRGEEFLPGYIQEIERLGVPLDAFRVDVIAPTNINRTLANPAIAPGGRNITWFPTGGSCTVGFNLYPKAGGVIDDTSPHLVTNSHCTGGVGGMGFVSGGATGNGGTTYGNEVMDPPFFTNSSDPNCRVGRQCRYSDSAIIEYNVHTGTNFFGFVVIRHPPPMVIETGVTITGTSTSFLNDVVYKTGRDQTTSFGAVQGTCVEIMAHDLGVDQGYDMLCQNQAAYSNTGGHSGSPIFFPTNWTGPFAFDFNQANAHGINWGSQYSSYPNSGPIRSTYSPISAVFSEVAASYGTVFVPCTSC